MSITFQCDDKDTLISFVYDDIDADARRQVAAHLRTCAACATEIEGLRLVRHELAEWQPPVLPLDFQIVQKPATVLRSARWSLGALPAWAQLAAAVLVMAVGAGIANLQVQYGGDGLRVSTGWIPPAQPASAASVALPANQDWRPALTALEADLRRELQMVRASASSQVEAPTRVLATGPTDANALLRRVQTLVNESEERQRQDLAIRMTQFGREVEMQRRSDLARINGVFGQLNGRTGVVEGNQREVVNLLRRVSTQQVP
jgi:anti-sigma factor RsiW